MPVQKILLKMNSSLFSLEARIKIEKRPKFSAACANVHCAHAKQAGTCLENYTALLYWKPSMHFACLFDIKKRTVVVQPQCLFMYGER